MEDMMEITKVENKGKHLNTLGKYHIFRLYKQNKHLNDNNIDAHNLIFNTIHKQDDRVLCACSLRHRIVNKNVAGERVSLYKTRELATTPLV
jgi:hypothetical protein